MKKLLMVLILLMLLAEPVLAQSYTPDQRTNIVQNFIDYFINYEYDLVVLGFLAIVVLLVKKLSPKKGGRRR